MQKAGVQKAGVQKAGVQKAGVQTTTEAGVQKAGMQKAGMQTTTEAGGADSNRGWGADGWNGLTLDGEEDPLKILRVENDL